MYDHRIGGWPIAARLENPVPKAAIMRPGASRRSDTVCAALTNVQIPLLVAATGPKGAGVAQQVGADGLISMFEVVPAQRDFKRAVVATVVRPPPSDTTVEHNF
jgi:hypothetical protein